MSISRFFRKVYTQHLLLAVALLGLMIASARAQSIPAQVADLRNDLNNPTITDAAVQRKLSPLAQQVAKSYIETDTRLQAATIGFSNLMAGMTNVRTTIDQFEARADKERAYSPLEIATLRVEIAKLKKLFEDIDSGTVQIGDDQSNVAGLVDGLEGHYMRSRGKPIDQIDRSRLKAPREIEETVRRGREVRNSTALLLQELERKVNALEGRVALGNAIPAISYGAPVITDDVRTYKTPEPATSRIDPAIYLLRAAPNSSALLQIGQKLVNLFAQCALQRNLSDIQPWTALEEFRVQVHGHQIRLNGKEDPFADAYINAALVEWDSPAYSLGRIKVLNNELDERSYVMEVAKSKEELLGVQIVVDSSNPLNPVLASGGCGINLEFHRQLDTPDDASTPKNLARYHHLNPFWLKRIVDLMSDTILLEEGASFDAATRADYQVAEAARKAGNDSLAGQLFAKIQRIKQFSTKRSSERLTAILLPFKPVQDVLDEISIIYSKVLVASLDGYRKSALTEIELLLNQAIQQLINMRRGVVENWKDLGIMRAFYDGTEDGQVLRLLLQASSKQLVRLHAAVKFLRTPCHGDLLECKPTDLKTRIQLREGYETGLHALELFYRDVSNGGEEYAKFANSVADSRERMKLAVAGITLAVGAGLAAFTGGSSLAIAATFLAVDVGVASTVAVTDSAFGRSSERVFADLKSDIASAVVTAGVGAGVGKFLIKGLSSMRFVQWMNSGAISRLPVLAAEGFALGAPRAGADFVTRFYLYHGRFPTDPDQVRALGQSMLAGGLMGGFYGGLARVGPAFLAMAKMNAASAKVRLDLINRQALSPPIKVEIKGGVGIEQQLVEFAEKTKAGIGSLFLAMVPSRGTGVVHWQVMYKAADGRWERVTASPLSTSAVKAVDKVDSGVFFKFEMNATQKAQLQSLTRQSGSTSEQCGTTRTLSFIPQGNCSLTSLKFMEQVGFRLSSGRPTFSPTQNFNHMSHGFTDKLGNPARFSVYETGTSSLEKFITWRNGWLPPRVPAGDVLWGGLATTLGFLAAPVIAPKPVQILTEGSKTNLAEAFLIWPIGVGHWILQDVGKPVPGPGPLPVPGSTQGMFIIPPPK